MLTNENGFAPGGDRTIALTELRDEDLIARVQRGSRKAFDELVGRYKGRLYSFILRMVKDPTAAEDLTQETLIRVYVHADKYREIARFSTWVFTIATNLVRNRMRRRSRRPLLLTLNPAPEEEEMPVDPPDPGADPSSRIEGEELGQLINIATSKIPEKYRIPLSAERGGSADLRGDPASNRFEARDCPVADQPGPQSLSPADQALAQERDAAGGPGKAGRKDVGRQGTRLKAWRKTTCVAARREIG